MLVCKIATINCNKIIFSENHRLEEAYQNNLIIKMILVSLSTIQKNVYCTYLNCSLHYLTHLIVCFGLIYGFFYLTKEQIMLLQFQFVNSFLSLFYLAFYIQDMDRLKDVSTITLCCTRTLLGSVVILLYRKNAPVLRPIIKNPHVRD